MEKKKAILCYRCGWTNCMERKNYRPSCLKKFNSLEDFLKYYYQKYIQRSTKHRNYCRDTFNHKHKWYIASFGVNIWREEGWFIGLIYKQGDGFIKVDPNAPYFW